MRWRERGRKRTVVEWWDGAKAQNKFLINLDCLGENSAAVGSKSQSVKEIRSSLFVCDDVLLL